jgi:hypothetical protein
VLLGRKTKLVGLMVGLNFFNIKNNIHVMIVFNKKQEKVRIHIIDGIFLTSLIDLII